MAADAALTAGQRFRNGVVRFAAMSLVLFPVLLLLRVYELIAAYRAYGLPDGAAGVLLRSPLGDLGLTLRMAAVVAIPVLGLAWWAPVAARRLHGAVLVIAMLASLALVQYFVTTSVPLGAELFGYSWQNIRKAAMSSGGVSLLAFFLLVVATVLTWRVTKRAARARIHPIGLGVFYVAVIAAALWPGILRSEPRDFASEGAYFLAVNKTDFFARRASAQLAGRAIPPVPASDTSLGEYPLLRTASYNDVLGPFFKLSSERPNIVIVIVEGLGRDFVGAGALMGGFMPFLDSLTTRSLYWENFLSVSGRTFGMLPSLLGSLPFAQGSFMELGSRMPRHLSLVSLLRQQGYVTNYFTGGDGHFDFIDVFMERQRVGRFVDQTKYGSRYVKQPGEAGFSWGYPDDALFRRSFELLGPATRVPRLDIYQTVTTHEPFIPPNTAVYEEKFERRLAALAPDRRRRQQFERYRNVFATLQYTDDALRSFFASYAQRADNARTIFIVTGDHRIIPIPTAGPLDRYHVPFIIHSPMVTAPRRFSSVSSHFDVTPSLLALLKQNYGLEFPEQVTWLGEGIDTAQAFRAKRSLAFMRTKNDMDEYLDGEFLLSGDVLFRLEQGFRLRRVSDGVAQRRVRQRLERFRVINRYVTSGEHLYPDVIGDTAERRMAAYDDSVFRALGLATATRIVRFETARKIAFRGENEQARAVLRRLLRDEPNNHDARTLLGRTYAWQRRFPEARTVFNEIMRRAPEYGDAYVALSTTELWAKRAAVALEVADAGLAIRPDHIELLLARARALGQLGRRREMVAVLDEVLTLAPGHKTASQMKKRTGNRD